MARARATARRTAFRDIAMGAVTLRVSNLDAITAYYRDAVALRVMDATGDTVALGRGGTPSVVPTHALELMRACFTRRYCSTARRRSPRQ